MATQARSSFSKLWILVGIAAALRLPLLFAVSSHPGLARQADDYITYGSSWLTTGQYGPEWFPPLYPLLCGSLALATKGPGVAEILALQFLLAIYSVILAWKVAQGIGLSDRGQWVAAAVMALDPSLIQYSNLISSETLCNTLVLGSLALLFSSSEFSADSTNGRSAGRIRVALAGIVFGLALLTRSVTVMLLPLIAIAGYLQQRSISRVILFLGCIAMAVLPWSVRNHTMYGTYSLSPSGAYNFAAVAVAPAKALVDGTDRVTGLNSWISEVPEKDRENPFLFGSILSGKAWSWLKENRLSYFKALSRSIINLFFGSDWTTFGNLLFGSLWQKVRGPFLLLVLLWRIVLFGSALLAVPLVFNSKNTRAQVVTGFCWISIVLLVAPVGAGGYGRFLVPVVPFLGLAACLIGQARGALK